MTYTSIPFCEVILINKYFLKRNKKEKKKKKKRFCFGSLQLGGKVPSSPSANLVANTLIETHTKNTSIEMEGGKNTLNYGDTHNLKCYIVKELGQLIIFLNLWNPSGLLESYIHARG